MRQPKMPLGISDFEVIRTEGYYYVDKTGMIRQLVDRWGETSIFTRPRRFGKSLTLSMLKCFFEVGSDASLFDGLSISRNRELCEGYQGQYPVISLSLKGVKGETFEEARQMLLSIVEQESMRHIASLSGTMIDPMDEAELLQLCKSDEFPGISLGWLSDILCSACQQEVIILIDEYDTPLIHAAERGYGKQMSELLSTFFSCGMKDNDSLAFAVMAGCLPVSAQHFGGQFNNARFYTLEKSSFDEWFGFTDREVSRMLEDCGLSPYEETTKTWYDGYQIGSRTHLFNPWSIVNRCDQLLTETDDPLRGFWADTSGNDVVRAFYAMCDSCGAWGQADQLLNGETVPIQIQQRPTCGSLYDSMESLAGVLFSTGYLTLAGQPDGDVYPLRIPNGEVLGIFAAALSDYFQEGSVWDGEAARRFCDALQAGDAAAAAALLTAELRRTVSVRDAAFRSSVHGNFCRSMVLGLLACRETWQIEVSLNDEEGVSDLCVRTKEQHLALWIELRYAEQDTMDTVCRQALDRLRETADCERERCAGVRTVAFYGVSVFRDQCRAALETVTL